MCTGNAAIHDHRSSIRQQALILEEPTGVSTVDAAATEKDFKHWLEGPPENIRRDKEAPGFELCRTLAPFTCQVMERRELGWMPELKSIFLKKMLYFGKVMSPIKRIKFKITPYYIEH